MLVRLGVSPRILLRLSNDCRTDCPRPWLLSGNSQKLEICKLLETSPMIGWEGLWVHRLFEKTMFFLNNSLSLVQVFCPIKPFHLAGFYYLLLLIAWSVYPYSFSIIIIIIIKNNNNIIVVVEFPLHGCVYPSVRRWSTVASWHERWGGDSSGVQAELKTGVDTIYSTSRASCAKLVNGGIVWVRPLCWGAVNWSAL